MCLFFTRSAFFGCVIFLCFSFCRGIFLGFSVCAFVESEYVFVRHLVFEIDDCGRVDRYAEVACLEMQVRACAAACVASERYRVSCFDELVGFYKEAAEVAVDGFKPVVVTYDYVVTITSSFVFRESDFSGECSADGVSNLEFKICAVMHTAKSRAISIIRGDVSGARGLEFRYVDIVVVWDCDCVPVGVYAFAVPKCVEDLVVHRGFARFYLIEKDVVVLDLEWID